MSYSAMTAKGTGRRYPDNTFSIIESALKTLGLDSQFLCDLTGVDPSVLERRLSMSSLGANEWTALCDALYLCSNSIVYGYSYLEHKIQIRWALGHGYFRLPRTRAFWRVRLDLWKDWLREWRWQGKHYGLRLRWKIRLQDGWADLCRKLDGPSTDYDPQENARTAFRARNDVRPPAGRVSPARP